MISALIIGLTGSLHCVGMCGPLMIGLKSNQSIASFSVYHSGRLLIYSLLGLAFGLIGQGLMLLEIQKVLSVIAGVLIILLYAVPAGRRWLEKKYYESNLYAWVRSRIQKQFTSGWKWLFAGILNGLVPCGLIYLAIAGSLIMASPVQGMLYMLLFGLGTLPALAIIGFAHKGLPNFFKKRLTGMYSAVAVIAGGILILRGFTDYPTMQEMITANVMKAMTLCGL